MRALMDFPYNNGQITNGDEFDSASDGDAELLKVFGRAEAVAEEMPKETPRLQKTNNYQTRNEVAEPTTTEEPKPKSKRYKRRDMRASSE